jgi:hypothetical protein
MTRPKLEKATASPADKRLFYVSLVIFLGALALVIASVISRNAPRSSPVDFGSQGTPAQAMTIAPELVANLTAIPQGIALSGDLAEQITQLEGQVKNCADYNPQRRRQMEQHFMWLRDPATLPREVALGIAGNPAGRLIFGMATFTAAEWGLHNRAADSCLLPIGRQLNSLLAQTGEETFTEFESR